MAPKRKATPSPSAPTPTPTPTPPSPSQPPSAAAPAPTASAKKTKTSRAQQEPGAPLRRSPRLDTGSTGASPAVAASPSASLPKGSSRAPVEKKSTKASLKKVEEEEVADEASKSAEDSQSDESTGEKALKTVVIEHCKQCKSFKNRATEVKDGLEVALPGIKVLLNPDKPRRGCFEVRVEGEDPFISLLEMKRPFSEMKALDMKDVIADIVKKMA